MLFIKCASIEMSVAEQITGETCPRGKTFENKFVIHLHACMHVLIYSTWW